MSTKTGALIYGATGYTGRLVAEHAITVGLSPILAGRSEGAVAAMAEGLGLPWRSFALQEPELVRRGLEGVAAILNAAGPFSATAGPLVDACIASGTHYCDITGEIDVFEALARLDADAAKAGVVVLPGAGFDVVPSDCLLAHVSQRVGGAVRLRLSIGGSPQVSRGTAKTMIELAHRGTAVRKGGEIVWEPRARHGEADFGDGPSPTVGVSYGDVSTAWRSTGARDVEAYIQLPRLARGATQWLASFRGLLAVPVAQAALKQLVDLALPAGPSAERRAGAGMVLIGEAWNAAGLRAAALLRTPEPYRTTELAAAETLRRLESGEAQAGFKTPSSAFGADFVLTLPGTTLTDFTSVEPQAVAKL